MACVFKYNEESFTVLPRSTCAEESLKAWKTKRRHNSKLASLTNAISKIFILFNENLKNQGMLGVGFIGFRLTLGTSIIRLSHFWLYNMIAALNYCLLCVFTQNNVWWTCINGNVYCTRTCTIWSRLVCVITKLLLSLSWAEQFKVYFIYRSWSLQCILMSIYLQNYVGSYHWISSLTEFDGWKTIIIK